jgi:plasmid maintenance system antidote protein VapI
MAARLSKAFGRTPEAWLQLQMQYDLAQIRQRTDELNEKSFIKQLDECLWVNSSKSKDIGW